MSNQQSKWDIIFAGFLPWVEKQPADKTYDYDSNSDCAFGQYLKALGYAEPNVGGRSVQTDCGDFNEWVAFPESTHRSLVSRPHAFGDLAERLKEAATT